MATMKSSRLEARFNEAMFDVYRRAKDEAGYNATMFLQMLNDKGGPETARTLINSDTPSTGYSALYERGRLDLTVEALVVENPVWHELFVDEEIKKARRRLRQYEYKPNLRSD